MGSRGRQIVNSEKNLSRVIKYGRAVPLPPKVFELQISPAREHNKVKGTISSCPVSITVLSGLKQRNNSRVARISGPAASSPSVFTLRR